MWVMTDGEAAGAAATPTTAPEPRVKTAATAPTPWEEFRSGLSPDTNKFIDLIIEKKRLTLPAAMEALGKDSGKGIGGVAGALQRKANNRGIILLFSAGKSRAGNRMWVLRPKVLEQLEARA